MKSEIHLVFFALVVLTGSTQTRGQSSALPSVFSPGAFPSHVDSSASPYLTDDPGNVVPKWTHYPAGSDKASPETTAITGTEGAVHTETAANVFKTHTMSTSSALATSQHTNAVVFTTVNPSAASSSVGLSSTPTLLSNTPPHLISTTESRTLLTQYPPTAFSSPPAHTMQDTSSTAHTSTTQSQSESQTRDRASTSASGPVRPTHQEVPSELNVGDEDLKGPRRASSPLDPLLAGLLSVFIVTTAIVFVALFVKFRQRTNHPEFHRLQDLPMDDLMEDTPLSRYTY